MTMDDGLVEKLVIKSFFSTVRDPPKPAWQFIPFIRDE
jgi:hypothetical protein